MKRYIASGFLNLENCMMKNKKVSSLRRIICLNRNILFLRTTHPELYCVSEYKSNTFILNHQLQIELLFLKRKLHRIPTRMNLKCYFLHNELITQSYWDSNFKNWVQLPVAERLKVINCDIPWADNLLFILRCPHKNCDFLK